MSTYYHAVCNQHRAISRVVGGRSFPNRWWQNDENELADFLREHENCAMRLVSEYDESVYEYTQAVRPESAA